jgi:hypothetical protein
MATSNKQSPAASPGVCCLPPLLSPKACIEPYFTVTSGDSSSFYRLISNNFSRMARYRCMYTFLLLLRSSRPTNRCHRTDGLTPQAPVNEMPPAHQMGHPKVLLVKPGPRDQLVAPGRTKRQVLQILMVARYSIRPALGKPRLLAVHNSRLVNLVLSLVHSLTSVVRLSPSASTLAAGVKSHFPIVHLLAAY